MKKCLDNGSKIYNILGSYSENIYHKKNYQAFFIKKLRDYQQFTKP